MLKRIALATMFLFTIHVNIPATAQTNFFLYGLGVGLLLGGDWAFDNSDRKPKVVWTADEEVLKTVSSMTIKTITTKVCTMCANSRRTYQQVWDELEKNMPPKERIVVQAATGVGVSHTAIRFAYVEK